MDIAKRFFKNNDLRPKMGQIPPTKQDDPFLFWYTHLVGNSEVHFMRHDKVEYLKC